MPSTHNLLAIAFLFLAASAWTAGAAERPNIILVMTDDQGYGDLACHGNPIIQTPHLDAFYKQAVRFTDFHVSPTCSPTRSALMTGRHEFKNGVTHTINERERLTLKAFTTAQVLKSAGYTTGIFGKWHLGDEADYQPDQRGFDEVFIHGAGGIGQTYVGSCGDAPGNKYFDPAILHNGKFEKTKGYCTDVFFGQALEVDRRQQRQGAAVLRLHHAQRPHAPLDCPPEYEAKYTGKVPPNVAKFYGMITNIDDNFGRLLAKLKEWGLERRHARDLHDRQRLRHRLADVQRRHARREGHALARRHARARPVALARRLCRRPRHPALTAHIDIFPTLAEITGAQAAGRVRQAGRGPLAAAAA